MGHLGHPGNRETQIETAYMGRLGHPGNRESARSLGTTTIKVETSLSFIGAIIVEVNFRFLHQHLETSFSLVKHDPSGLTEL